MQIANTKAPGEAANSDAAEPMKLLTATGADVNAKDNNGETPLHAAGERRREGFGVWGNKWELYAWRHKP